MKRRSFLYLIGATSPGLAGCLGDDSEENGDGESSDSGDSKEDGNNESDNSDNDDVSLGSFEHVSRPKLENCEKTYLEDYVVEEGNAGTISFEITSVEEHDSGTAKVGIESEIEVSGHGDDVVWHEYHDTRAYYYVTESDTYRTENSTEKPENGVQIDC
ncbi:hypothetical protein [Natrarchaeobaculum sulfurireducens]|uniref:Membrane lipoprotein n=1 Tax=Natrarchaeobaculum sulfurireducens TaxID=2044521 RepID=A0A346PIE1_9EURY|nr:hypothetical protein [Natrarchaeobaculum sulfurireducens]AXR79286.1 hypothetical protein AArc1_2978 [Natrarchaeobaculum sulfurireducens]